MHTVVSATAVKNQVLCDVSMGRERRPRHLHGCIGITYRRQVCPQDFWKTPLHQPWLLLDTQTTTQFAATHRCK